MESTLEFLVPLVEFGDAPFRGLDLPLELRPSGRGSPAAGAGAPQALDLYASVSARFEVGRTHPALAELAQVQGDREGAGRHLQEAYRLFTALRVPRYIARAEAVAKEFQVPL